MTEQHKKDLDPYVATKQVFQKRVKKTKHYRRCKKCKKNEKGFYREFNQWCYMCSQNCNPKDHGKTYSYKDKFDKWHVIRY